MTKPFDFQSLVQYCPKQDAEQLKANLKAISNQIAQVMVGNNSDSQNFVQKTLKINLGIGSLIIRPMSGRIGFEPLPVDQIMAEEDGDNKIGGATTAGVSSTTRFGARHRKMASEAYGSITSTYSKDALPMANDYGADAKRRIGASFHMRHKTSSHFVNPITGNTHRYKDGSAASYTNLRSHPSTPGRVDSASPTRESVIEFKKLTMADTASKSRQQELS